jgi:hypothetical protein
MEGLPEGPACLKVVQFSLSAEPEVRLAGRVEIEGGETLILPPVQAERADRTVLQQVELEVPPGASTLRVVAGQEPGGDGYLRLVRLSLYARPDQES